MLRVDGVTVPPEVTNQPNVNNSRTAAKLRLGKCLRISAHLIPAHFK